MQDICSSRTFFYASNKFLYMKIISIIFISMENGAVIDSASEDSEKILKILLIS